MAKKRPGRPAKQKDYTRISSGSIVTTIECIYDPASIDPEAVENALDTLREAGAAEIVKREVVARKL